MALPVGRASAWRESVHNKKLKLFVSKSECKLKLAIYLAKLLMDYK